MFWSWTLMIRHILVLFVSTDSKQVHRWDAGIMIHETANKRTRYGKQNKVWNWFRHHNFFFIFFSFLLLLLSSCWFNHQAVKLKYGLVIRLQFDRQGGFRFVFFYCCNCLGSFYRKSRSMLVTNLYRMPPYVVSSSLRSCFRVLLVEPKNRRSLSLSEGRSVRMRFIFSGMPSPVSSCWELFPWHTTPVEK